MSHFKHIFFIAAAAVIVSACNANNSGSLQNDWASTISSFTDDGKTVDYDKLARLNLALAETGQLAEKAFNYTQAGSEGLCPEWDKSFEKGKLLSDIYFSMGHIALSQRMAFETTVLDEGRYNAPMMLRLIQTNIIYGEYKVAQKYINILSEDRKLRKQAQSFEKFIDNDKAVEDDSLLGPLRKCIPPKDFLSSVRGIDEDLKDIIRANPYYHKAIEYLGVMYLLDCETEKFRSMMDEFNGTEALPQLPKSFAEAACMMSEIYPNYWKTTGVDKRIYRRYQDFLTRLGSGLSMDKFKDTYWYYMMRINSNKLNQVDTDEE